MDDFKVKVPKTLPSYTEDSEIETLFTAIENKKTHKGYVVRDSLLGKTSKLRFIEKWGETYGYLVD